MKRIEVVAGIISNKDGDILCTQRNVSPYPYISKKYEAFEKHVGPLDGNILEKHEEWISRIIKNK